MEKNTNIKARLACLDNLLNMKNFLFLFLILSLGFITKETYATHAAGLEITYDVDPLNPSCYIVTVKFYRDCDGISAPGSLFLNVESASCGQFLSATANQVSFTEISPIYKLLISFTF